ncbi:MAG: lysostaphin resistance A-like protein [Planctomycetaceae bacterium]
MFDPADRTQFLNLAAMFEGGMVGVAIVAGWLLGVNPLALLIWDFGAIAWGVVATLPLFGLFLLSIRYPIPPLERIQKLLVEFLGPSLEACRPLDLIFLAVLAGVGEELLFRGVLQPLFERFGPAAGLIGSNIVFGLAHAITPTYALLAGAIGLYLGVLLDASGSRNLMAPIVTHALYDYLAFLVVLRLYRDQQRQDGDSVEPDDRSADP